jgi:hypothetical protein
MASVETPADTQLVGLGPGAETRLPASLLEARRRIGNGLVIALLVGIQLAWVGLLLYAAYFFIGS